MTRAELSGSHSHPTALGVVHVYKRNDSFLARGRYQRRMFGVTLGKDPVEATIRLRELLVAIDRDSFVPPSEARKRPLARNSSGRLTLRELIDAFLAEKRKLRGKKTANTYRARLGPTLDFAENSIARKRWPFAADIDRDFATELRVSLQQRVTTRNGRPGAAPKLMSEGQIVNSLECLRTVLCWAHSATVRKLLVDWVNPLTPEVVGSRPPKDPLRRDPLPLATRVCLVDAMDCWQLCHLIFSVVLPLRPGEAAGLLISDVNFTESWLELGTRFSGADFTKGRTSFVLPFPREFRPILEACIDGREEGPLLRARRTFERRKRTALCRDELHDQLEQELAKAPSNSVLTAQDRKAVVRRLLRRLGGVTEDQLAKEAKALFRTVAVRSSVSLYTLRSSVTTAMQAAGLSTLDLRYVTSHSTTDILNAYVSLDPVAAMQKYFATIRPLLDIVEQKTKEFGL